MNVRRYGKRFGEGAERAAERRRREDSAPRLAETVPNVESLELSIQESRGGVPIPESAHLRKIPVKYAPALFVLPCMDTACREGGHDVTQAILDALKSGNAVFEGEHTCAGQSGGAECQRVLHYTARASYQE